MAAVSSSLIGSVTSRVGVDDVTVSATDQSQTQESPPPTAARLPPDGHEFPPDFPLSERLTDCRSGLTGVTLRGHEKGHDLRSFKSGFSVREQEKGNLLGNRTETRTGGCQRSESMLESKSKREKSSRMRHPSESDLRKYANKSVTTHTSVRDRIALFSSDSKERLATSKLKSPGSENSDSDEHCKKPNLTRRRELCKSEIKLVDRAVPDIRFNNKNNKRNTISDPSEAGIDAVHALRTEEKQTNHEDSLTHETGISLAFPQGLGDTPSLQLCDSSTEYLDTCDERSLCPSSLSERSQSLLDLGKVEKRHSYAGLPTKGLDVTASDLPRKTSINSIMEERKKGFSRLRGLVIPNKVDGVTRKGPADMPPIKSKTLSTLSKNSPQLLSPKHLTRTSHSASLERPNRLKSLHLSSPPWKADSLTKVPKYSPAFKRKNVSMYPSLGDAGGSAFRSVSSSSRLGGSSIELSHSVSTHDHNAVEPSPQQASRHPVRSVQQKRADLSREPLQRSSSLNSRQSSVINDARRRVSDDLPGSRNLTLEEEDGDVGSSTLTLVAEPFDKTSEVDAGVKCQANSVESDHRASTSTLHGSPVKEIDIIEEDFGGKNVNSAKKDVTNHVDSSKELLSKSEYSSYNHMKPDEVCGQREDTRRTAASCVDDAGLRSAKHDSRDLFRLHQSPGKPSVTSLKEKWQTLSGEKSISPSPSSLSPVTPTALSRSSHFNPDQRVSSTSISPGPVSPSEASLTPCKAGVHTSVRDVVDRNWPSIESERADIGRKLSTPNYGDAAASQRHHQRGRLPSRPQSWVENETEVKLFEMGGLMGSDSKISVSSSQENIMDALDAGKSPSGSTSSLLEMLTANLKNTARSKHVLSVSDLRRAFERSDSRTTAGHPCTSLMDSSGGEDAHGAHHSGSSVSLHSAKEHYGSITSLASSTSLISPHELQQLIEEANQSLEEAGTPSHEIIVAVIHREMTGGSVGITLAGGADYENKEISVNKVLTGSVADRDGRIKKGDRVISINGRSMKGTTHREALNILKAPRAEVVLVLSRPRSVTPSSTSDELGFHKPSVINTFSSRPPKILESPMDSKSLASSLELEDVPWASPAVISLYKEGAGVGFSLEGGKDSPLGDRPLLAKKIFAGGAADKSGKLHVGDQILAINDEDITHMPRIEAWNFLKKQPEGALKLTIRKRLASESSPSAALPTSRAAGALQAATAAEDAQSSRPVVTAVTPKAAAAH